MPEIKEKEMCPICKEWEATVQWKYKKVCNICDRRMRDDLVKRFYNNSDLQEYI